MFLGMFIALPLALKRRVDASFSAISMLLYLLLAMNLFTEAFTRLTFEDNRIFNKLNYWNFDNYLRVLPIFLTCLSCQPQLFEVFDHSLIFSEEKNALARINQSIKQAIFICSLLYIGVGLFGYLAFFDTGTIEGNLIVNLPHSLFSIMAKLGFLFTIVLSLPLCLFPCRTSLHSLIYGRPTSSLLNEMTLTDTYIPDNRWLFLTVLLIVFTICISISIPHIEFILGLVGSTTGALCCLILPSLFFINLTLKHNSERVFANLLLYFGLLILLFSTFSLINVDQQELTSEGQLVKNLNLSTNRIEKLIEQNEKLNQIKKVDDLIKKDLKLKEELLNELKDSVNKELGELKSKELNSKELKSKELKSANEHSNLDELKVSADKTQSKKEKSGFINAVEMKKKSLSKEKLDDKSKDDLIVKSSKSVNQSKTESKLNRTIVKNAPSKVVDDKKASDKKTPVNKEIKMNKKDDKLDNELKNKDSKQGQDLKTDKKDSKKDTKNDKIVVKPESDKDVKVDKDFKK